MILTFTNEASAFKQLNEYERLRNQYAEAAERQEIHIDLGTFKVYELQALDSMFCPEALAITEEAEVHFQYARNLGHYMVQLKSTLQKLEKGIAL